MVFGGGKEVDVVVTREHISVPGHGIKFVLAGTAAPFNIPLSGSRGGKDGGNSSPLEGNTDDNISEFVLPDEAGAAAVTCHPWMS